MPPTKKPTRPARRISGWQPTPVPGAAEVDALLAANPDFAASPLGQLVALFRDIHPDDIVPWPLPPPQPEPLSRKQRRALKRKRPR